ncbi:DUF3120 domain-containing protein [Dapis sp. BLCC M229]|uniref:DUF3120 domain-containing protein n=1 Tax=Dapis sp. BLCC M229 TaxID=3400188 RepID=UPI003CF29AB3
MFENTFFAIVDNFFPALMEKNFLVFVSEKIRISQKWAVFGTAVFLVSVPVFFQAPMVRQLPWLSLGMTGFWLWLSLKLLRNRATNLWGDLLLGFTWSWFTGSIYWGWLRQEPFLHLPVEAMFVPLAIWSLRHNREMVGNCFYLGSLLGTAVTDGYFYITGLIPYWRQLMIVEPEMVLEVFQDALTQVRTSWGITWIIVLVGILLLFGIVPLQSKKLYWWGFGAAVLSTILVDSLFLLAAFVA